jgi:hypothetical protein
MVLPGLGKSQLVGEPPGPLRMVLAGLLMVVILGVILLQSKFKSRNCGAV